MKCVFLIGSGVSRHLGMYSWSQILELVASSYLHLPYRFDVKTGNEYQAATALAELLGGEHRLNQCIVDLMDAKQRELEQQQAKVARTSVFLGMGSVAVINMNWDTLITDFLAKAGFEVLVWPSDPSAEENHLDEVQHCIRYEKRFVWHLHGAIGHSPLIATENQRKKRERSILKRKERLKGILGKYRLQIVGTAFPDKTVLDLVQALVDLNLGPEAIAALTNARDESDGLDRIYELGKQHKLIVRNFLTLAQFSSAFRRFSICNERGWDLFGCEKSTTKQILRTLQGCEEKDLFVIKDLCPDPRGLAASLTRAITNGYDQGGDIVCASKASMLLTKLSGYVWDKKSSDKLERLVRRQIAGGSAYDAHYFQPLAYLLCQHGRVELGKAYLEYLTKNEELRYLEFLKTSAHMGGISGRWFFYPNYFSERHCCPIRVSWDLPTLISELYIAPKRVRPVIMGRINRALHLLQNHDRTLANEFRGEALRLMSVRS
jgi:hypothetical protein